MPPVINMVGSLNPRSGWTASHCNIARSVDLVGARSTLLILREAFYGTMRFDDFASRVGISESVAAARLRELVDQGMLEREAYREAGQRTRHQYRLTPKGADFLPVLVALMRWGDRWIGQGPGPVELQHHECGELVDVELRCGAGHRVEPDELDLVAPKRRRRITAA